MDVLATTEIEEEESAKAIFVIMVGVCRNILRMKLFELTRKLIRKLIRPIF